MYSFYHIELYILVLADEQLKGFGKDDVFDAVGLCYYIIYTSKNNFPKNHFPQKSFPPIVRRYFRMLFGFESFPPKWLKKFQQIVEWKNGV